MPSSRRCSLCGISYPDYKHVCLVCGDQTDLITNDGPDTDWQDKVRLMKQERAPRDEKGRIIDQRTLRLLDFGFSPEAAIVLATDPTVDVVYAGRVLDKVLAAGEEEGLAVRILV